MKALQVLTLLGNPHFQGVLIPAGGRAGGTGQAVRCSSCGLGFALVACDGAVTDPWELLRPGCGPFHPWLTSQCLLAPAGMEKGREQPGHDPCSVLSLADGSRCGQRRCN